MMLVFEMQEIQAPGVSRLNRLDQSILAKADDWALFLDIDGTLLDMASSPDAVHVPPGLVDTLAHLKAGFGGAVALVTGRRIADADRFFAPLRLDVVGVHGAEARSAHTPGATKLGDPVPQDLTWAVHAVADRLPGILVEDKGVGLAVHYRHAPETKPILELELKALLQHWSSFAVRSGRKVLDVVPRVHTKGTGLAWLMSLPAFKGRRPVMIGDDRGDEPALRAAERLGGFGLRVAGEHFSHGADFDSPTSVRLWLARLSAQLSARPAT